MKLQARSTASIAQLQPQYIWSYTPKQSIANATMQDNVMASELAWATPSLRVLLCIFFTPLVVRSQVGRAQNNALAS
eukprot:5721564-Amphidinium_carterae.1